MPETFETSAIKPAIIFAGTPSFAADHLRALINSGANLVAVITQPDKPAKRGNKMQISPVKALALEHHLPLLQPPYLRFEDLKNFEADVMVVVAYGQILKADVFQAAKMGSINVHASALPRWRGAAPIQRAIQAGDEETGITIIRIEKGLDTGDMLALEKIPIASTDTASSLGDKLSELGQKLLIKVLEDLNSYLQSAEHQDNSVTTYANKLTKEEAKIDWNKGADQIERDIRAFNPDPVAYCYKDDLRIRIWAAFAQSTQHSFAVGQILSLTREGLAIACGKGVLYLTSIQLPLGKGKPLSPLDLMNSRADLFKQGTFLT